MTNINRVTINDTANGDGIRVTVWFQGCRHHCKGCHNPETWNPKLGQPLTNEVINKILDAVDKPYIKGLTLSGGDPLYPLNVAGANSLCNAFRERFKQSKDLWIWTGYLWEELTWDDYAGLDTHTCIRKADVLIDGKFDLKLKDPRLKYRGSSNQRVIDVQQSIKKGRLILWDQTKTAEPLKYVKTATKLKWYFQRGLQSSLQDMTFMLAKIRSFLPFG